MKAKHGSHVKVHYRGTLNDGTEFDNSHKRGWPLEFRVGSGQMIAGFDNACVGLAPGQVKTVKLPPDQAYGVRNPEALQPVPKAAFGPDFDFKIGAAVQGNGPRGPFLAKIHALEDEEVVLDLNHPLAGEHLQFQIEMVEVDTAPKQATQQTTPQAHAQAAEQQASSKATWNESMKKPELFQIAKESGLKVNSKTTKENLIKALQTL